jgi:TPR repeat protein
VYLKGEGGVKQDSKEAQRWFEMAGEKGDSLGFCHVAYIYHNGVGVEKNMSEAKKWYEKAASVGSMLAVKMLASLK